MDPLPIYLDYNATTPIAPVVADAMLPFLFGRFGNPSSPHAYGREARAAVERARAAVARLVGAPPGTILFTSGGSESNNAAILGTARARSDRGRHVVTSAIEHPAVAAPCQALAGDGWDVTVVGVDEAGRVDPEHVRAALRDDTVLVTIMHANNEVGTIQPIAEIARHAHARGAWVHTDAAQSVGKVPVDVDALGVDMLTIAGHKLYAPKGVGALYVREGIDLPPLIRGAGHEGGRRAGTENVLEVVGLGRAATLAREEGPSVGPRLAARVTRLWDHLRASGLDLRRNGDPSAGGALPNTLSVGFRDLDATSLLAAVQDRVAASAGAACHGRDVRISSVLAAMRVPEAYARGTVRLSVGTPTTEREVDEAARVLVEGARRLLGARSDPRA